MKQGVILCGLNGSGKSTLGRALAQRLGWEFLDIEDCFFPKTDPSCLYANPRSPQEAAALLVERATAAENFVLASVKGHYPGWRRCSPGRCGCGWTRPPGPGGCGSAPMRSSGERIGPGATCSSRRKISSPLPPSGRTARWRPAGHVTLPVVEVDGTLPIQENVERLAGRFSRP